jgi:putative transposase
VWHLSVGGSPPYINIANPAFLNTDWRLAAFAQNKGRAIEGYKQFVTRGKNLPSPWKDLRNQVYLGNDLFVKRMDALIGGDKDLSEVPSS